VELTKTQSRVLAWMDDEQVYVLPGGITFAGLGRTPKMVGTTITRESFRVHLLAVGRYGGGEKGVDMEPDQARDLANQLNQLADRCDQLRRDRG
jgi:hypothetical protein